MTVYLKEWRKSRGKTQRQVGIWCGLSNSQISRIEVGKQRYDQRVLEAYARYLGCQVIDLFRPPGQQFVVVDGKQRLSALGAAYR